MDERQQFTTLAATLERNGRALPHDRAVTAPEGTRCHRELSSDVARIADRFDSLGLQPGDRVAVLARNGLPYVQLVYAASWSGVSLVCLNWRLERDEIAAVLDDSEPSLVFTQDEFLPLVPGRDVTVLDGPDGGFAQWYAGGAPDRPRRADQGAEDVALLLYTTGTTGRAKGVQLTEQGLWHMCLTATEAWEMGDGTRFLACLPLFHVSGMSSAMCAVFTGGEVVIPAGTTVAEIASAIVERSVTHTVLVPTVLTSLVAERAAERWDLSCLRVVIYGSAPSGSSLIDEAMSMLPTVGFSQGYGLTETCAGVAIAPILRFGQPDLHPGSVGRLLPTAECRIVDVHTGEGAPPGHAGEILLRTPQLTPGYWRNPELTAAAIDDDGWFRTGDIGALDQDGFLYVRDRLKDMIISGGENIYSVEVENAILAHPAVLEVAVVGEPDPRWGESVRAVLVLREGEALDHRQLASWLDGRLARYKRPRVVEVVSELPKTGSGKVLKRALRPEGAH
ncbi:class I adenylate-forming enzyme family protein [Nocardioides litoris]|uniref:class I adenylate-forming enzyme family protein n=1 Tax=Nocardioides litoris TaxID=1926648 RepID=UPI001124B9B9|nr:class I adenylate-forming enzyme family protein [Nocardioides litoris]